MLYIKNSGSLKLYLQEKNHSNWDTMKDCWCIPNQCHFYVWLCKIPHLEYRRSGLGSRPLDYASLGQSSVACQLVQSLHRCSYDKLHSIVPWKLVFSALYQFLLINQIT